MSYEMKTKTKDRLSLTFLVLIYLILQLAQGPLNRFSLQQFNGVIAAFQYGLCLLMLRSNRKIGVKVSIVMMSISILMVTRAVLVARTIHALPGLVNSVFYMITLLVLASYHKKREKESVTDLLTGAFNRRGMYKHLKLRIEDGKAFGVLYISLDNFKFINDTYGHAYGDELMRKISAKMTQKLGGKGSFCRTNGTDIVVALEGDLDAAQMANDILSILREKITMVAGNGRVDCYLTCYGGLAAYPKDATDYESLIKYADIAMLKAMSNKEKRVKVFVQEMADQMNREIVLEKLIKEGLEKDYFYLVYQPQYHLEGKKLRGFETLIRMQTPDGNVISPGEFIPVAEKGDLILQIDDYVLRRAMREFRETVRNNTDLVISVNVSAKNIGTEGFIEKIQKVLEETNYPAQNLEIEITEYCMVDSMEVTIQNISGLKEMGIQIALDDFGTGYTSLNYVAKLPIDLLKVDKSLIDDIEQSKKSREFVQTVISMGHLMGFEVISEGVENEKQLGNLKEDGCDFVQGYVWGKPLSYESAIELSKEA